MRRLILALSLLTILVAVLTVRSLPERCEFCDRHLVRLSVLERLCHGRWEHPTCLNCFARNYLRPSDRLDEL